MHDEKRRLIRRQDKLFNNCHYHVSCCAYRDSFERLDPYRLERRTGKWRRGEGEKKEYLYTIEA